MKVALILLAFLAPNFAAARSFNASDPVAMKDAQHFVDSLWKMFETVRFKGITVYFTDDFEKVSIGTKKVQNKAEYLKEVKTNFKTKLGLNLFYKNNRMAYFEQKEDGIQYLTLNVRRNATLLCTTNLIKNPAVVGGYQIRRITDSKY